MLTDVRNLGGAPSSRDFPYSRGCKKGFPVPLRASGELSADGAPPFVRAIGYPRPSAHSDSFAPPWAKGSRAQVVGSVREAPWGPPLRGALLVLFSRQGEKSTHINLPDKLQFIFNTSSSAGRDGRRGGLRPCPGIGRLYAARWVCGRAYGQRSPWQFFPLYAHPEPRRA